MFCIALQVFAKGDVESGAAKVAACASCHGNDGNSMVPVWPKLAGIGEKYIFQQLLLIKNKERVIVEMTGLLDASTEQDLWDMAAYYNKQGRSLSGAEEIKLVNVSDPSEALAMGERVYRAGNLKSGVAACTGCHAPSGSGNGPAGYPALGGQHADYIEKQLLAYRRGERRSGANAQIMQGVAQYLSDDEIKAVANYIAGLN
tara:strand:- start:755 stop:1360 length:606 start_codon:yes stop_codon:yes gene_type:complete